VARGLPLWGYRWRELGASGDRIFLESIPGSYYADFEKYWTGLKKPHYSQVASLGELFSKRQESSHEHATTTRVPPYVRSHWG
jgi:hypothetical protein